MNDFTPQGLNPSFLASVTPNIQANDFTVQSDPMKLQAQNLQNQQTQNQVTAGQLQNQYSQQTLPLDVQNAKLANAQNQMNAIYSGLAGVTDQDSWNRLLGWAQNQGIDTSRYPQQYDPGVVNRLQMGVLSAKDRMDFMFKQQQQQNENLKTNAELLKAGVPPTQLPYGNPMTANGGPSATASAGGTPGAQNGGGAQQPTFGFDQSNLANMNTETLKDMKKEDSAYQQAEAARAQPLRNMNNDLNTLQTLIPQYQTGAGGGIQRNVDKAVTAGSTLLQNMGVPVSQLPVVGQAASGIANTASQGDEINNTANRVVLGMQALQPTKGIRMTNAQLGLIKGGKPDINTETGANIDTTNVIKGDVADQQIYDTLRAQYRANSPYGVADPQFDNFYNALVQRYPITTQKDGKTSINQGNVDMLLKNAPTIIANPTKFVPGWTAHGVSDSGQNGTPSATPAQTIARWTPAQVSSITKAYPTARAAPDGNYYVDNGNGTYSMVRP